MKKELTEAQKFCVAELCKLIGKDSKYRVGALFLTYAGDEPKDHRIASAVGMGRLTVEAAVDVGKLVERLRQVADELEAVYQGRQPLPDLEGFR